MLVRLGSLHHREDENNFVCIFFLSSNKSETFKVTHPPLLKFCQNRYCAVNTIHSIVCWCAISNLCRIRYFQNKIAYLFIIHNLFVLITYKLYISVLA